MNPYVDATYGQVLATLSERMGDREALVFQGRRFTFAAVKQQVDAASRRLASLGLQPGETLAIWMPNRPEFLWYWLGAAQTGLVAVFLNTRLRRDEFVYQLAQSESRAVLVPGPGAFRDFLGELAEVCPELARQPAGALECEMLPHLRHVISVDAPPAGLPGVTDWSGPSPAGPVPPLAADPSKPALVGYSSGTTALPKGAMLTHCIWRKAWDGGVRMGLSGADRLFLCVPLFGVLGFLNGVLMFWSRGCSIVLEERFDATRCLQLLQEERCTCIHLLPTMIDRLLEHPDFQQADLSALRAGIVLSSDPEVMRKAAERLGVGGVVTGYGLTESTGLVTRVWWNEPLETRVQSQGKPLPDCPIRVVDPETGRDQPPGEMGEILIGGYSVMAGYYNKPEETAKAITSDGWLRSGDAGYLRPDGSLVFLRRLKDGYKHKGFNVSTPEVEAAIKQHPAVSGAAVVGVPDPQFGESGVAFVVLRPDASLGESELIEFLRPKLASFKLPAHMFAVDEFPRTGGTEKIRKFVLRDMALERLGLTLRDHAPAGKESVDG